MSTKIPTHTALDGAPDDNQDVSIETIMVQIRALGGLTGNSVDVETAKTLVKALQSRPELKIPFAQRLAELLQQAEPKEDADAEPAVEGKIAEITAETLSTLQESLRGYIEEILQAAEKTPEENQTSPEPEGQIPASQDAGQENAVPAIPVAVPVDIILPSENQDKKSEIGHENLGKGTETREYTLKGFLKDLWPLLQSFYGVYNGGMRVVEKAKPNTKRVVGAGATASVLLLWEWIYNSAASGWAANARLAGDAIYAPIAALGIGSVDIVARVLRAYENNVAILAAVGDSVLEKLQKKASQTFDQLVPPARLPAYLELTKLLPATDVAVYSNPYYFALACVQKMTDANPDGHIIQLNTEEQYAIALAYGRDLYRSANTKAGTLAQGMLMGSAAHSALWGQAAVPLLTLAAHWLANQAMCADAYPASQFAINADGELERVTASQAAQTAASLYDPAHLKDPTKIQGLVAKDNLAQAAEQRLITLITEYLNKHPEKSYPDAASMGRDTAISQLMLNMLAEEGGVIPVDANREEEVTKNKEEKKRLEGVIEELEGGLETKQTSYIDQINQALQIEDQFTDYDHAVAYCESSEGREKMQQLKLSERVKGAILDKKNAVVSATKEVEIQRKKLQKVIQKLQELEGTGASATAQAAKSVPVDEFAKSQKYNSYKLGYAAAVVHCFEQLDEHRKKSAGVLGTLVDMTPLARLPQPVKAAIKTYGLDGIFVGMGLAGIPLGFGLEFFWRGVPYLWRRYITGAKKEAAPKQDEKKSEK